MENPNYIQKNDMPLEKDVFVGYLGTGKQKISLKWITRPPSDNNYSNFDCAFDSKPKLSTYGDDLTTTRKLVDFIRKIFTSSIIEK